MSSGATDDLNVTVLLLGNEAARQPAMTGEPDSEPVLIEGKQVTTLKFPHGNYKHMLLEIEQIVGPVAEGDPVQVDAHFDGLAGPSWVECDDAALAQLVASQYHCEIGRPADWPEAESLAAAVDRLRHYGLAARLTPEQQADLHAKLAALFDTAVAASP